MSELPFEQEIFTAFSQAFRAAGTSMSGDQLENLRTAIERVADLIRRGANEQAIVLVRSLQDRVDKAFTSLTKELDLRIKEMQDEIDCIRADQRKANASVSDADEEAAD
jgi:uncharacterized small protein (DUF1192 family)